MFFTPSTLLKLFSRGLAINREPSSGDAPSRKTETLIKGSCILGLDETCISCLAYDSARRTSTAITIVVFAFERAKSMILVILI